MARILSIILVGIITSLYFFPFVSSLLPMANTKMIMALMGLIILGLKLAKKQRAEINSDFFILSLIAIGVSFAGLIAVILNNTPILSHVTAETVVAIQDIYELQKEYVVGKNVNKYSFMLPLNKSL